MSKLIFCLAALLYVLPGYVAAQSPPQETQHVTVRGVLSQVSQDLLQVRERQGEMLTLKLTPASRLFSVFPATLADARPGVFIGVGALPLADGTLEAREIHLFAERLRGTGEGHTSWRLPDGTPGSMTNGTVGTLSEVREGRLVVSYAGGQQTVQTTPRTPVVFVDLGQRDTLQPGQHVVLTVDSGAQPHSAEVIRGFIGMKGVTPPF